MNAGSLEIELLANIARLQQDMNQATQVVGQSMSTIQKYVGIAKSALVGFVAGMSVSMFADMAKSAIDAADNLNDLSKATGVAVEQLAGLDLGVKQSGGELEGIASSINKLGISIVKESARFAKLGITAKEPLEAFKQFADVFTAIQDPQLRAALGADALGKSWEKAAPLLSEGSKKIGEMVEKGTKLAKVTQDMANNADEFNDMMEEFKTASDGMKTAIVTDLLPAVNEITRAMLDAYKETGALKMAWIGFGGLSTALFTDEFLSAPGKVAKLREELVKLEDLKGEIDAMPAVGFVGRWLFGNAGGEKTMARIQEVKSQLAQLTAVIERPALEAQDKAAAARKKAEEDKAAKAAEDRAREFLRLNDEKKKSAEAAAAADAKAAQAFVAGLDKEVAMLGLGESASRLYEASLLKLTAAQKKKVEKDVQELAAYKEALRLAQERSDQRKKESEDIETYLRDQKTANQEVLNAANAAVRAAQEEYDLYGMAKSQVAELTLARLQDKEVFLDIESEEGKVLQGRIAAQQQLIAIYKKGEIRDQQLKDAEAQKQVWESIDRTAHDTFISIFDSGKSAFDRLRDTLKNGLLDLLYQMTIKKWIMNIGAAVTGGTLGAVANAATGGLAGGTDGASNGLSALGSIAQMGSSLVSTFTGGMQVAFQKFAFSGMGSTLGLSAATPMTTGGIMGTGSMVLPGTPALTTLGSIGSGIAAVAPYIAAAALLYQGLQMGEKEMTGQTVTGSLGGNNASNDLYRNVSWSQSGGFLRNDRSGTWSYNLANSTAMADGKPYVDNASLTSDKALLGSLMDSYDLLKNASADYAKALGLNADDIKTRTDSISFAVGKDAAETQANITKMFEDIGNKMAADLLTPFASLAKSGETASQTLTRLAADVTGANEAMKLLGYQTYKLDESGIKAAESLVTLFGGLQNLQSATSTYYDRYYTDAEKATLATTTVAAEFKKLGLVLPDSLAQMRNWIEAAKALGTEAGDKTYVSLMQLAGTFAGLTDATSKLNDTASQKAQSLADSKSDYILRIMEAQGLGQQALNLQRQKEIMLLDAELRPYAEKLELALREKDARELATRQAGLAVEILRLEGKETLALALQRKLELAAMEEGLRPQQLRIYALQDEASQLEILKGHRALDIQLMRALGNEEGALAAERADALKGLDAYSKGIMQQIWAAEAATAAAEKAKQASEAESQRQAQAAQDLQQAMQKQADEAKALYDKKISEDRAAIQEAYNAEASALQQVIDKMGGFAKAARAMQESLRFGADSAMTRAQKFAVAQYNMPSISAAARGGDTAAIDQLKQYVDLLKASASSSEEYVVGVAKVIAILDGAADTAETQESIAKSQLSMLKQQVDAILGVDSKVMTVAAAIAQLNTDLQGGLAGVAGAVYGQYQANNKASTISTTSASTQAIIDAGPKQAIVADVYARYREAETAYGQLVKDAQKLGYQGTESDYTAQYGGRFNLNEEMIKALSAKGYGVSEYLSGVPQFAVGTNYVPNDMLAMIHEGEAIIPKAYNPSAMQADSQRTQALEQLVENLTDEVKGLRAEARATAVSNSKIEYVMRRMLAPEGDAIATREVGV